MGSTIQDFWFCKKCSGEFWVMYSGYEFLKTSIDSHNNESCISELINRDRMDFWFRIHAEAVKLWDDANCYKCYDWNSTLVNNGTIPVEQKWSEEFASFMLLTEKLEICEKIFFNNSCTDCLKNYTELNKFYETIKKKNQINICFDIENSMNRTRRYWSRNLGCCRDDEASFLVFTLMASIFGALPVLFYFSAYFMTKRMEDHSPVNDGETQITPNISSINSHEPVPGPSITGSSNASTAVFDDVSTNNLNNTPQKPLKSTNIKNIAKTSNIAVNPNNLLLQNNLNAQLLTESLESLASQNLINLERSTEPVKLINLDDTSSLGSNMADRTFI